VIAVGPRRAHDFLFNGVQRYNEVSGLVHKEGTPSGHAMDIVFMKLCAFLKKNPDVVQERALGVVGAAAVTECLKPVKLWPPLPLLAGRKNWD
jgi:hypothetical protein